ADMWGAARWDKKRRAAAADDALLVATDWADYLVRKKLPFRQAHEAVGKLVALSIKRGVTLRELTLKDLQTTSKLFRADALRSLDVSRSLAARKAEGAPSPARVAARLAVWRRQLSGPAK
ncbi:MAG: argininosuccinate lyase, partial [Chthoniobacterales bacterium]